MQANNGWLCPKCGHVLGKMLGGELYPSSDAVDVHTAGPNLNVTCPDCGNVKVFYTSDPVVRAVYQLTGAVADVAARSMIAQVGRSLHTDVPEILQGLKDKTNS